MICSVNIDHLHPRLRSQAAGCRPPRTDVCSRVRGEKAVASGWCLVAGEREERSRPLPTGVGISDAIELASPIALLPPAAGRRDDNGGGTGWGTLHDGFCL